MNTNSDGHLQPNSAELNKIGKFTRFCKNYYLKKVGRKTIDILQKVPQ